MSIMHKIWLNPMANSAYKDRDTMFEILLPAPYGYMHNASHQTAECETEACTSVPPVQYIQRIVIMRVGGYPVVIYSSVADHWLHKPGVLGLILGDFTSKNRLHACTCLAVYIEECEVWWSSGCRGSVADHWLHKPGVLGLILGDYRPFHFPPFRLHACLASDSTYSC